MNCNLHVTFVVNFTKIFWNRRAILGVGRRLVCYSMISLQMRAEAQVRLPLHWGSSMEHQALLGYFQTVYFRNGQ